MQDNNDILKGIFWGGLFSAMLYVLFGLIVMSVMR